MAEHLFPAFPSTFTWTLPWRGSQGHLLQPCRRTSMWSSPPQNFLDLGRRDLRSQLGGQTPWSDPRRIPHPTSFAWLPQGTCQWGCLPPGRGQPRASAKEKASAQDQRDRSLVLAQLDTVGQLDFTCPEGIAILSGCRSQGGLQIDRNEPFHSKFEAWIGLHKHVGKTALKAAIVSAALSCSIGRCRLRPLRTAHLITIKCLHCLKVRLKS